MIYGTIVESLPVNGVVPGRVAPQPVAQNHVQATEARPVHFLVI